jgi:HAD superfamily hydrolase (TIGR01549 family)
MAVDLDDVQEARELLADARCVLFDFDGPICRLFPRAASKRVARELVAKVDELGFREVLTDAVRSVDDPHAVLGAVHQAGQRRDVTELLPVIEGMVTKGELDAADEAVGKSRGTKGAERLIRMLSGRRVRLAVVTNNSPLAAKSYLKQMNLLGHFAHIHGRTADPGLMKPHPDVLQRALRDLDLRPENAVMIGDTDTDLLAAERAGVGFIGYDTAPLARARLRHAGAKVVLGAYAPLLGEAGR